MACCCSWVAAFLIGCGFCNGLQANAAVSFEVWRAPALPNTASAGRLFVIVDRTNAPEPRMALARTGSAAPEALALDVEGFAPGTPALLSSNAFAYPHELSALSPGKYWVQALFAGNRDLNSPNAPGNLYSEPEEVSVSPADSQVLRLELTHEVPPEELPPGSRSVKFLKLESKLLTEFHHRPMFLRAGIILPRDYNPESSQRYPLWVRIGGLGTRFTVVNRLMSKDSGFRKTWEAAGTPPFILLQLDGAGPYGDPYYVNSENNGPYGDALVKELIPYVEQHFNGRGDAKSRVLSGVSTGGWVALALQIFYPDFFNGAWAACPDPVDFRAFELVNVYRDANAYLNPWGYECPSERDINGNVVLTARDEVGRENLLGRGNSFTCSGQQWGAWNAVYSPRGDDGLPMAIWDHHTGKINNRVAAAWRAYDLRLILQQNWSTLGPKLRWKLHIAAGEADQYFLNNAVHLLQDFLVHAEPPFEGRIVFGQRKRHGWSDVDLKEMLAEMAEATK